MISLYCSPNLVGATTPTYLHGWRRPPRWAYAVPWRESPTFFTEVEQYLAAATGFRVAFYLTHWSPDFPGESPAQCRARERDMIMCLSQRSDLVFVLEHEVQWPCICDELVNLKNVYWIMPGTSDVNRDRVIPWQYHVWRIKDLYEELPHLLLRLDPYRAKTWYFDAMLGMSKGPRPLVAGWIHEHGLQDRVRHSLGPPVGESLSISMFDDRNFFLDPEWQPVDYCDYRQLNQHVKIQDKIVQMPCLMPLDLYNHTAYSIICETGFLNDIHMITEKTAKAVIGRRLFVMFAGRGFLRYVREQGFRTFDGIIDESYDLEPDAETRWRLAFEQVRYLCGQDQTQILERARPIVEHNYARVMSKDLSLETLDKIQQLISQYDH